MDKLKMQTRNLVDENIEFIKSKFPNCVTEGKNENDEVVQMVDFDLLKQELSHIVIDGDKERYMMTWPDKKQAIFTANAPIAKTLRPCKEESVNFDTTQNLYIEGDNLHVLKLMRETYLNKVKMIYIDPPYNTGNDFVYEDDFATNTEEYLQRSNQVDEQGNRMVTNNDSKGRFHTDWLNMIYPRLKIAKDLLTDDGVIFISIDDNEQANLKKICDEIFGESNFLVSICVNRTSEIATNYTILKHEYILVYMKNNNHFHLTAIEKISISRGTVGNADQTMPIIAFPAGLVCNNIKDGIYNETRKVDGSNENIENLDPIIVEAGKLKYPVRMKAKWRSSNDMRNFFNNNCKPVKAKINGEIIEIYFENDKFNPQIKKKTYEKIPSIFLDNKRGSDDMKGLSLNGFFDFPKSVLLIKYLLSFSNKNDLVLDFFSGSATTAHAVMQLNAEDGGSRKFIMVQVPEPTSKDSEAYKAGYKNICEIGKERIRRAGAKIQEKHTIKQEDTNIVKIGEKTYAYEERIKNLDTGFRVLKLDSSNMKGVYYNPNEYNQNLLERLGENIKEDRTPEDLLFQVMLDMGILLSSDIKELNVAGKKVFNVNNGNLICCFDNNLTNEVITEIAKLKPEYAVFRDSSLSSDSLSVNFDQIFKTYYPEMKEENRKVI
ncbi:MAG: site-specific DNA-methyltransferase [Spirochaetales bacterium]